MSGYEQWVEIEGCSEYYISNYGNVKNLNKGRISTHLKPTVDNGYLSVTLTPLTEDRKVTRVHRLVANHFVPNPDNLPVVNHINGRKSDNSIENLEWVTQTENLIHAYINNLITDKRQLSLAVLNDDYDLIADNMDKITALRERLVSIKEEVDVAFISYKRIKEHIKTSKS